MKLNENSQSLLEDSSTNQFIVQLKLVSKTVQNFLEEFKRLQKLPTTFEYYCEKTRLSLRLELKLSLT